jgi:cysteine synthase
MSAYDPKRTFKCPFLDPHVLGLGPRSEEEEMPESTHRQVLVVGGGTAGITVSAILKRRAPATDIAIVEPSPDHYYQPAPGSRKHNAAAGVLTAKGLNRRREPRDTYGSTCACKLISVRGR